MTRRQAATLVQDGKLLYEMGKFEEAGVKLNQALKLDPDNQGAFYYLNLVKQANYAREEHNRTTQAQDSMVQVSKAWSPKDLASDCPCRILMSPTTTFTPASGVKSSIAN